MFTFPKLCELKVIHVQNDASLVAIQRGYRCYGPQARKLLVILDVFFRESELYNSEGVLTPLPRKNASEGNMLQIWQGR